MVLQSSAMELFAKLISNVIKKMLPIFAEKLLLDAWLGLEWASAGGFNHETVNE